MLRCGKGEPSIVLGNVDISMLTCAYLQLLGFRDTEDSGMMLSVFGDNMAGIQPWSLKRDFYWEIFGREAVNSFENMLSLDCLWTTSYTWIIDIWHPNISELEKYIEIHAPRKWREKSDCFCGIVVPIWKEKLSVLFWFWQEIRTLEMKCIVVVENASWCIICQGRAALWGNAISIYFVPLLVTKSLQGWIMYEKIKWFDDSDVKKKEEQEGQREKKMGGVGGRKMGANWRQG